MPDFLTPRTRQAWQDTGQQWRDLLGDRPSVAQSMQGQNELAQRLAREGGPRAMLASPELAERTADVAANVDLTGSLDLSTAARMARAKAMGFDVDRPVYHGTTSDFDRFSGSAPRKTLGGLRNDATFVTPDPKVANRYAQHFDRIGEEAQEGGNVIKGFIRSPQPVRMTSQEFQKLQKFRGMQERGEPFNELNVYDLEDMGERLFGGYLRPDEDLIGQIRQRGYTSLETDAGRHGLNEREIALFDPSQIRSVHAKFDPKKRRSADLLASVTGGGLLAGGLLGEEQRQ